MSATYWPAYAMYAGVVLAVANRISGTVAPYMDETLHIPQAQTYCTGEWSFWDPLITTPPGLYLISALPAQLLPGSLRHRLCSVASLRLVNTFFLLSLPYLYSRLLTLTRHPIQRPSTKGKASPARASAEQADKTEARWEGLAIGCFPVVAFFGWLYYTDLGSIVLILWSYEMSLRKRWAVSALIGAPSLWFRQTNIAWLAFIAGTAVVHHLETVVEVYNPPLASVRLVDPARALVSLLSLSVVNIPSLAPVIASYLPVFVGAAAFVKWNGGIVLGDKQNHVPTVHIPQLYYFTAFTAVFLMPVIGSPRTVKSAVFGLFGSPRRIIQSAILLAGMMYSINHYTIAHPFLLADNRHYAFYLWRRIINVHPLSRFALAPGYLLAGRLLFDRLSKSSTLPLLPTIFYLLALSLTLIPTPLIEPRYFLTPFLLLRLHLRPLGLTRTERYRRLVIEAGVYILVGAVTVWVFLEKGFSWGEAGKEGEVMRFMW